jgi:hypothetical protein
MKFNIQEILSTLTRRQRMLGLIILVVATVLIFVLPPYFKSVSPEILELKETISFQQSQIDNMNVTIIVQNEKLGDLNNQIIINQQECTNRIVEREKEIMSIIEEMKSSIKYTPEKLVLQDSVMSQYTPRVINEDKSYKTLCDLEKKIKKKN